MKNIIFFIFITLNLFSKTLTLGVNEALLRSRGFDTVVNLVKISFENIGYDIRIIPYPNIRALTLADQGKIDGSFPYFKDSNPKFDNIFLVAESVGKGGFYAYTLKEQKKIESWKDLKDMTVAYILGSSYIENKIKNIVETENILTPKDMNSLFKLLEVKRVQAIIVVLDENMIKELQNKYNLKSSLLETREAYLYLNNKYLNIKIDLEKSIKSNKNIQ